MNVAAHIFQRQSVRAVFNVRLDIHQLAKTLEASVAILKLLGEIDEGRDRLGEHADVQQEGHKIRNIQAPVRDEHTAGDNDAHLDQRREKADASLEGAHVMGAVFLGGEESLIADGEFAVFLLLVGEGFDHADASEIVLDLCVDLGDLFAIAARRAAHASVQNEGKNEHDRQDHKRRQRQLHIDADEDDEGADDLEQRENDVLRSVVQKLGDVEKVVGDTAHQLANLGVVVERERELLQMVEDLLAHVVLDLRAHDVAIVADEKSAVAVNDQEHQKSRRDIRRVLQDHLPRLVDQGRRHIAHNQRNDQRHRRRQRRKEHIRQKNPHVGLVITQHFFECIAQNIILQKSLQSIANFSNFIIDLAVYCIFYA